MCGKYGYSIFQSISKSFKILKSSTIYTFDLLTNIKDIVFLIRRGSYTVMLVTEKCEIHCNLITIVTLTILKYEGFLVFSDPLYLFAGLFKLNNYSKFCYCYTS